MKFYCDLTKAPTKEKILVLTNYDNIYSGILFNETYKETDNPYFVFLVENGEELIQSEIKGWASFPSIEVE